jgi:hypothetical protein
VAAALHDRGRLDVEELANEVAALEADGLGAQVAGHVVGKVLGLGLGRDLGVEALLLAQPPQELARVADGVGDLLGPLRVLALDELGPLAAQHHRAGRVDGHDLGPGIDVGLEQIEVVADLGAHAVEITALPRRHPAALEVAAAADVDAVALEHLDRVLADLRLVVLDVAGLKQHHLTAGELAGATGLGGPAVEGLAGEFGQLLVAVDADDLLHEPAVDADAVELVDQAEAGAGHRAGAVGVTQGQVAQRGPVVGSALGLVAVDELGEVELELVAVAGGVGALDLAQLALEALVHDPVLVGAGQAGDVAVVLVVDEVEQAGERVAVLEAHAAAVADLEHADDLLVEGVLVPIDGVVGVVAEALGGLVGDVLRLVGHALGQVIPAPGGVNPSAIECAVGQ